MAPKTPSVTCTYCSKDKRTDAGEIPAVHRYLSQRITRLHRRGPMVILSGEYGLLGPDDPIPWYDHLLQSHETEAMTAKVATQLTQRGITALEFHTADPDCTPQLRPYLAVITAACERAKVALSIVTLASDEP